MCAVAVWVCLLQHAPVGAEVDLLTYPAPQPWTLLGDSTVDMVEGQPVVVCRASPNNNAASLANVTVRVPPGTEALQLDAEMRADTLIPGREPWHTARAVLAMLGQDRELLGYGAAVELHRSSGWVRQRGWVKLKPGTRFVRTVVSNHAQRGTAWFRNITVTQAPPVPAHPYSPGLPLGTFEYTHPDGFAKGWFITPDTPGITIAQQGRNTFLRIVSPDTINKRSVAHLVELPDAQRVTVQARIRSEDLAPGQRGWHTAMLRWCFTDKQGNRVGDWPDPPRLTGPADAWRAVKATAPVPDGAAYARLEVGLFHAAGVADFDDVTLTPAE